jgi:hypothetical protein
MKIAISKEMKIILTLHKVIKIKIMMRKCKRVKMITLLMLKSTPMRKVKHSRMKKNRENKIGSVLQIQIYYLSLFIFFRINFF